MESKYDIESKESKTDSTINCYESLRNTTDLASFAYDESKLYGDEGEPILRETCNRRAQIIRAGFRLVSMNMRDYETGKSLWFTSAFESIKTNRRTTMDSG